MKRAYLIGGLLAVTILGAFLYYRSRRKAAAAAAGPTAGGIFAPKNPLLAEDWANLEKTFQGGNPFNNEKAQSIEGQPTSETEAAPEKTAISKSQFDNMVLTMIRQHIGQRSAWIQDEEIRRFDPSSGAARAGYSDSLARAFAYSVRVYLAGKNYYTPGANAGGTTNTAAPINYNAIFDSNNQPQFKALQWTATNIPTIITAQSAPDPVDGTRYPLYYDTESGLLLSKVAAKMRGVNL